MVRITIFHLDGAQFDFHTKVPHSYFFTISWQVWMCQHKMALSRQNDFVTAADANVAAYELLTVVG